MSLAKQADALRGRKISVAELVSEAKRKIDAGSGLNAFITERHDLALQEASEAQRRIDEGDSSPLCGMPIAIKDIFMTKGDRTTCGSQILGDFVAPYESHVTSLLRDAGTINVGKCNLDEFAMGTTGENSSFGPTLNPWDEGRSPGGSSSGSAAAVAARIVASSIGTDTGGSVRMPAAYCGVCGIKPTYGLASRRGMVAYASSLDQAGAFATSAADLRIVLGAMLGHDPMDSTSLTDSRIAGEDFTEEDLKGLRIGVAKEFFAAGVDGAVASNVMDAVARFEKLGATVSDVSIAHLDHAIHAYYIIACAEASSNLARYDGLLYGTRSKADDLTDCVERSRSDGFGDEVQRRVMLGAFVLSHGYVDAYYRQAQRVRRMLMVDFAGAFEDCDLIATPAAPTTAPKLGAFANDPVRMYSQDVCTVPVNLAGLPAIAVPCGLADGLPAGIQLIGPKRSEHMLLGACEQYQLHTNHHEMVAPGAVK